MSARAVLVSMLLASVCVMACGPGRGSGQRRARRKMTPLVFKQHVPNVSENTLGASGPPEGRIGRSEARFNELVVNNNPDIVFKNRRSNNDDRFMSQRCKEKLNTLSVLVMNQWPAVRLRVTDAWIDDDVLLDGQSLHLEGRAVDVTTSDRDRSKYGMLARLAVDVGFDWVYFESRAHIHCSVKSDTSIAARNGGCFPASSTVQLESGGTRSMADLSVGERVLTVDSDGHLRYDDVIAFVHRQPQLLTSFTVIATVAGRRLVATGDHLIFTSSDQSASFGDAAKPSFVAHLHPGNDSVYVTSSGSKRLAVSMVTNVTMVTGRGVFAPLTSTGTIVVDGVAASCYALVSSHRVAHWSMAPVRLAAGACSWWTCQQNTAALVDGVHWYAQFLRRLTEFLLPDSDLWFTR